MQSGSTAFKDMYLTFKEHSSSSSSSSLISESYLASDKLVINGNSTNYQMSLQNYELILKYGSTNKQSYLTYQSLRLTNGSREIRAEVNNSSWQGSVITTDYIQVNRECFCPNCDSDARLKKDIAYLDKKKAADFIYGLKPLQFRFISFPERLRHGFITRDVKPIAYDGWGIVHTKPDGYENLAYTEIIADLVATVQTLNDRLKALEGR